MRLDTSWAFDLGADVYGWFTAQSVWRASCRRMAEHLPDGDGLRILDLGCGPGVSTIELARARPAATLIGADIARRMLAEARRWLGRSRLPLGQVRWVAADAAHLPFADASVDAVTGHSFLYLLPHREAVLAEVLRVLRPGGRLVLMEPHERRATLSQLLSLGRDPRHLIAVGLWRPFSRLHGRFSPGTLAGVLTTAGFSGARASEHLAGLAVMAGADKP